MRGLRDLITDLRPATLDQHGLQPALEALAERMVRGRELGIELDVDLASESGRAPTRLVPKVEETLYRVVQEALANVLKHAAASRAEIVVREHADMVEAAVSDNGSGFDPDAGHAGFGLLGMRERVSLLDGTLTVQSAPRQGSSIRIRIPVQRAESGESRRALGA